MPQSHDSGTAPPRIVDRARLARRRERALALADPPRFLLDRASDEIIERLALIRRQFPIVLNLGAHDGHLSRRLLAGPSPPELLVDLDPCAAMLARCPGLRVRADEALLPIRPGSLDLVVSALSLHFVDDVPGTLIQVRQALKPDGLFLAATLGGDTLVELREALMLAEVELREGASPRVLPFADVRAYGGLLQRAGFALAVADVEPVRVTYAHPLALLHDLRAMGASSVLAGRPARPLTKRLLARAMAIYAERHAGEGGRVVATFDIIILTGWAPDPSQPKPLRPGTASVGLAEGIEAARRKS